MDDVVLRIATPADREAIEALMRTSIGDIFPRFYDAVQTASAVRYVGELDAVMVGDGTYFALEAAGELVGSGGWSKRDLLYTGSGSAAGDARLLDPATEPARVRAMFVHPGWTRRGLGRRILEACEAAAREAGFRDLALMATLPGVALYEAYGFRRIEETEISMPDGVTLACVAMSKPVEP
jgi:N-acetylglutamate synthase-like GNAT family acetyltransferase